MGPELWERNVGYAWHGFSNHHWTHLMQPEAESF